MRPGPATSTPRCCPSASGCLGPEHPDTLTARGNLARWTGEAGDAAGARDQFAALLPIVERVLGPEHPGTLITRDSLAYWTGEAGDAAAARDQFAALLPHPGAGPGRRAPGHPGHPRQPRPLDRGDAGMRPGPATSSPRCCPSSSGSWAPSTRTP